MPTSKPNKKQNKNNKNKNRTPPRRKRRKQGQTGRRAPDAYTMMIADPCNATLVPGLFGASEGLLARLKENIQATDDPDLSCGYLLWCPEYSNVHEAQSGETSSGNLFMWQSADPGKRPTNFSGAPYGSATSLSNQMITAYTVPDPAANLLKSDIVADARCVGACLQLTYYGRMAESSGEIAFISNLPVSQLFESEKVTVGASVNQLMQYTNTHARLGTDTVETVFRPSEDTSSTFRSEDDACLIIPDAKQPMPGVEVTTLGVGPAVSEPRVFGFVWRNVAGHQSLSFDITKSIEWRAEVSSGLTQVPLRSVAPSQVARVNRVIDSHPHPRINWHRVVDSASSQLSKIALTGTGYGQRLLNYGANAALNYGGRLLTNTLMASAPLLLM
jgi:hypothetical protein